MELRKIDYKLYPNSAHEDALLNVLRLQKDLHNGALEERIDCYKKTGQSLSYNDQQKSLTQIRGDSQDYKDMPVYISRMTLRRLDKSFKAFFGRVKRGETPGFPRFKSMKRFKSFEICEGSGWKFNSGENNKHGVLYIRNIGHIKARGKARTFGKIKTSQIIHKHGDWFLSLTVECEPTRVTDSKKACGIDWGVEHLLSITHEDASFRQVENPRYYETHKTEVLELERSMARKKRGSARWKRACKALSQSRAKIARKRHQDHHQLSHNIAKEYALVASEKLDIKQMTRADNPSGIYNKTSLNRRVLDTSPAKLMGMIRYKVEETGGRYEEVQTKKVKPSQRCPDCLVTKKKPLKVRHHICTCGCTMKRDVASGLVMLRSVLGTLHLRVETIPNGLPRKTPSKH